MSLGSVYKEMMMGGIKRKTREGRGIIDIVFK